VTSLATIRKERRLSIAGQVLVKEGVRVRAEDIVAQAELPGDVATVNVVNQLGIAPAELPNLMLKKVGEPVKKDEIIAQTKPFLKFLRSSSRSPIDGTIETVSHVTGQVMVRTAPKLVHVRAYVDGTVVEVWPGEGVAVQTTGAFIQGILGVGGEVAGEIAIAPKGPDDIISLNDLGDNLAGKIVVAGRLITRDVFDRAGKIGIAAIVCGGFHDADLRGLLGYDLGVAITGHEDIHPTLIITEGFGEIAMARGTYDLLASHAGHRASANGATQIRAGVLRPEIIIPRSDGAATGLTPDESHKPMGLTVGCLVRIIREPGFGRLGTVKSLPPEAQRVESEAKVRVVELEFPGGETMLVPRTNVEVIGS
jgi:hypothetical protein